MKIVCALRQLQEDLDISDAKLASAIGIKGRSLKKLLTDSPGWRLDRDSLYRLLLFGFEHGCDIFQTQAGALWRSFEHSEALIFRGRRGPDSGVEAHLVAFLKRLQCETKVLIDGEVSDDQILEYMATTNCIFIGAPIGSTATDTAISAAWTGEPGNEKVAVAPVRFIGRTATTGKKSLLLEPKGTPAIAFHPPLVREVKRVGVHWQEGPAFAKKQGEGTDAALVVAKQTTGTHRHTTLIIAGYTGLATDVASRTVTREETPLSHGMATDTSRPIAAILRFRFRKRKARDAGRLDDPRRYVEGSGEWSLPTEP